MIEPFAGCNQKMARAATKSRNGARNSQPSKYDAHNTVLSKTYGALADLRRELSDSKADVTEREELLRTFASCADSQRAWLLLEDYFERHALSRKDFPATDWWPRVLAAQGRNRLEELAFLFLRAKRSLPTELSSYANLDRFAQVEKAAHEQQLVQHLEEWLFPPRLNHLDAPRAALRVVCQAEPDSEQPVRHRLAVQFLLMRPRAGEKVKSLQEVIELTTRAAHEQEQFPPADWEFISWLAETHSGRSDGEQKMILSDLELLNWLARWGHTSRLEMPAGEGTKPLGFHGQVAE